MEYLLWFAAVAIGPVILAAAMIYAIMRKRRFSRAEQIERDRKTRELYTEDEGSR